MNAQHLPNDPPHEDDASHTDALGPSGSLRVLEAIVEPVLRTMGYDLVHLEWGGAPRTLRVYIDHSEGITLADCTRISPIVSTTLDAAENADGPEAAAVRRVLAGPYQLEVSSPGLDRPLSRASQFRRAIGQRADVRTIAPLAPGQSQKNFHGRIVAVDPDPTLPDDEHAGVVHLADQDDPDLVHLIPLALLKRANLVYEGDL